MRATLPRVQPTTHPARPPRGRRGAPPALHAGGRRPAGPRRGGGRGLPRGGGVAAGRLPRRRRLLRDQRLPDHVAAAGRAPGAGSIDLVRFWMRRARRLLPAVFVMIAVVLAAMLVLHPDEVGRLRGAVAAPALRRELVPDLRRPVVLRGVRPAAAVPPPVVAGGGGAVLPAVAAGPGARAGGAGQAAAAARRARAAGRVRPPWRGRSSTRWSTRRASTTAPTPAAAACWSARRWRSCGRRAGWAGPPASRPRRCSTSSASPRCRPAGADGHDGRVRPAPLRGRLPARVAVVTAVLLAVVAHPGSLLGRASRGRRWCGSGCAPTASTCGTGRC